MDGLEDSDGILEDSVMATRRQWSNVTAMDGMKVMDIATAMAMDGLFATLWQWTGNGDECRDGDDNGNGWLIGSAMGMNGSLVARR